MKAKIFTVVTVMSMCFFAACGSGNGSTGTSGGATTDSLKTDNTMAPAPMDTSMKTDSGMHKADTSSMPK